MRSETNQRDRILVVDENLGYANMMASLLERADDQFVVETMASARGALDHLVADSVDCVVSTYELPDTNGLELLASARENCPGVVCVLLSRESKNWITTGTATADADVFYRKRAGIDKFAELALRIRTLVETIPGRTERSRQCVRRPDRLAKARR